MRRLDEPPAAAGHGRWQMKRVYRVVAGTGPAPTDPPPRSSTGRGRQGSRFARPCAAGERRGGRAREKPARCAACPRSEAEGVAGRQPGLGLLKSYLHRAHASPELLTALRVERKPESNALSTTMWREARQRHRAQPPPTCVRSDGRQGATASLYHRRPDTTTGQWTPPTDATQAQRYLERGAVGGRRQRVVGQ